VFDIGSYRNRNPTGGNTFNRASIMEPGLDVDEDITEEQQRVMKKEPE
jgi:hypothetical protein